MVLHNKNILVQLSTVKLTDWRHLMQGWLTWIAGKSQVRWAKHAVQTDVDPVWSVRLKFTQWHQPVNFTVPSCALPSSISQLTQGALADIRLMIATAIVVPLSRVFVPNLSAVLAASVIVRLAGGPRDKISRSTVTPSVDNREPPKNLSSSISAPCF